jgi:hypothetical protein
MSWCQPVLRKFINGLMKSFPASAVAAVGALENDDDAVDADDDASVVFNSKQHCVVCYGKTQSGKTGVKAVAAALCLELGIDFKVLTKGRPESGLHVPIFVFEFFKMTRGVSCRSDKPVPTHIVAALGSGYSIENMLQALGRATFNGKSTLEKNVHMGLDQ